MATSLVALQGPRAASILARLTDVSTCDSLRYYAVRRGRGGRRRRAIVARTGYTGEDGFELFVAWDEGPVVWRRAARAPARRAAFCPAAWAPATRCAWRPACRSTATSLDRDDHAVRGRPGLGREARPRRRLRGSRRPRGATQPRSSTAARRAGRCVAAASPGTATRRSARWLATPRGGHQRQSIAHAWARPSRWPTCRRPMRPRVPCWRSPSAAAPFPPRSSRCRSTDARVDESGPMARGGAKPGGCDRWR